MHKLKKTLADVALATAIALTFAWVIAEWAACDDAACPITTPWSTTPCSQ